MTVAGEVDRSGAELDEDTNPGYKKMDTKRAGRTGQRTDGNVNRTRSFWDFYEDLQEKTGQPMPLL